jgi:hypothetical protein
MAKLDGEAPGRKEDPGINPGSSADGGGKGSGEEAKAADKPESIATEVKDAAAGEPESSGDKEGSGMDAEPSAVGVDKDSVAGKVPPTKTMEDSGKEQGGTAAGVAKGSGEEAKAADKPEGIASEAKDAAADQPKGSGDQEGPGIDAGPSAAGKGGAAGVEDAPNDNMGSTGQEEADKGDSNSDSDCNYEADKGDSNSESMAEPAPAPREEPPPLPYRIAADFGFTTENTATFMGLRCLADVELFVPVSRLNLDHAPKERVVDILCKCVLELDKTYSESVPEEKLFALQ